MSIAVAMIWACLTVSNASVIAPDGPDEVFKWAIENGKPGLIKADLAELLSLAHHDISIRERAFSALGETHLIAVSSEAGGPLNAGFIVISRISQSDGAALIWRGSLSGQLLAAVRIHPVDGVSALSVQQQIGEFLAEKEFFRRKMHELQGK